MSETPQFEVEKPGLNSHHGQSKETCTEGQADETPLKVQASGHKFIHGVSGKRVPAVIDMGDGFVLKALQKPPRGEKELTFYQQVSNETCTDPDVQMLRPFLPQFAGTVDRKEGMYMKLSNLINGYHKPCVMDLKMGRITYDCNATQEKISKEISKFPPAKKLGFQITGMVIYDPLEDTYTKITKDYARNLTEETIVSHGLGLFFRLHQKHSRLDLLPPLLVKLRMLEQWFSVQKKFSFIASSLLVTYDGHRQHDTVLVPSRVHKQQNGGTEQIKHNGDQRNTERREEITDNGHHQCNDWSEHVTYDGQHQHTGNKPKLVTHNEHQLRNGGPGQGTCEGQQLCNMPDYIVFDSSERGQGNKTGPHAFVSEGGRSNQSLKSVPLHGESNGSLQASDVATDINDAFHHDKNQLDKVGLHLIDFAHVFPSDSIDHNVLFGIRKLISCLQSMIS